jgi:hypothetical protein
MKPDEAQKVTGQAAAPAAPDDKTPSSAPQPTAPVPGTPASGEANGVFSGLIR